MGQRISASYSERLAGAHLQMINPDTWKDSYDRDQLFFALWNDWTDPSYCPDFAYCLDAITCMEDHTGHNHYFR